MLAMAEINYIKHLREKEDLSINGIAKKLKVNWRTAKRYADKLDWNINTKHKARTFPSLEAYQDIVDAWLLEDQTKPKKQRHTAQAIYMRLHKEHGYQKSARSVRDFVKYRKDAIRIEKAQSYARLAHPGGEAQVDFGTIKAFINGLEVQLKILVLSFPYSNASYISVVPSENIECFLEGMKRIFEQIGGVPTRIWFDNLSAAVTSIKRGGNRKLTQAFEHFSLHYRFEAKFCNPAKGNEKGHVENKVGYIRRNWCVPVPIIASLDELQDHLSVRATEDMNRLHYKHQEPILSLWNNEKDLLLKLPLTPFDVVRLDTVRVNKYQEIKIDNKSIPIAGVRPGDHLLLKVRWRTVEILDRKYRQVCIITRPYPFEPVQINWKAQLEPFKDKPRALLYASSIKLLPDSVRSYLFSVEGKSRRKRLSWILRMLTNYSMESIGTVLHNHKRNIESEAILEHALYEEKFPNYNILPIKDSYTPSSFAGYNPDPSAYDRLYRGGKSS